MRGFIDLSERWLDKDAGPWVGIVCYRRDGLLYEHAVDGELLDTQRPGAASHVSITRMARRRRHSSECSYSASALGSNIVLRDRLRDKLRQGM
jgi:hypothetical protein